MGKMRHNTIHGVSFVHEENAVPIIKKYLKELNFKLIVELGTSDGGFTINIVDSLPKVELHTFDNRKRIVYEKLIKSIGENVHFYINEDILKPNKKVIKQLKRDDFKLLYCDNGNKPKEFELYAGYLNKGDFIGVHDYDKEYKAEEINKLHIMKMFKPWRHEIFEENNWSTRFWEKII